MVVGDLSQPAATDWERNVDDPLLREDLHRCLAGNPVDRFASANEVAGRIRSLARRRRRRHAARLARAAVAALTLLLVVGGAWLSFQAYQRKQAEAALERETGLRNESERRLYNSHMLAARKHWEEGKAGRLRELLDTHIPKPGEEDLRGFEWYYLDALSKADLYKLTGHNGPVRSVAWSPDGRRLATASNDGVVRIWDTESWQVTRELGGHESRIVRVYWSADGSKLASTEAYRDTVRETWIWDLDAGKAIWTVRGTNTSCPWSPDGQRVAVGLPDGSVRISTVGLGERILPPGRSNPAQTLAVIWSPNGRWLAAGDVDGVIQAWDLTTSRSLYSVPAHSGPVRTMAWSPDSRRIVNIQ